MTTASRAFPKTKRLLRRADFKRVYDRRLSVSDSRLIVYAASNDRKENRVGLSVSRKFGGAVRRNRLRRLLREAYRLSRHRLPTGLDLIFIPRSATMPALADLLERLPALVSKLAARLARDAEAS